jgi:DNA polymerase III delta prime subunit
MDTPTIITLTGIAIIAGSLIIRWLQSRAKVVAIAAPTQGETPVDIIKTAEEDVSAIVAGAKTDAEAMIADLEKFAAEAKADAQKVFDAAKDAITNGYNAAKNTAKSIEAAAVPNVSGQGQ